MIFSSYKFIFLFLPITLAGFVVLNKLKMNVVAKLWLVAASFYFYGAGSPAFLPFFIGSVFFNYIIGSSMNSLAAGGGRNRKMLYFVGLAGNIGLLGYFKYTDFFISNVNMVAGTDFALMRIVLPIGISFFTFQLIAYLVDTYRGLTKDYDVLNYLLFITFFPQLIVGPIVHHKDIVPQFEQQKDFKFNKDNVMLGIFLFSVGCGKKIILADPLTNFAEVYFSNINVHGITEFWQSWFCSLAYTISYYFDLSGYADMAIGLGFFFNVRIPVNFNSPYRSRNFAEYWRKWHMTLSKFLSDYIFRSVYKKGKGSGNFYLAVMVTFFVSGFWHGAGWTFVAWGLLNGIFVVSANFMERRGWKLPAILAHILTILGVVITRVLFVSSTFTDAYTVYKTMLDFSVFKNLSFSGVVNSFGIFVTNNLYVFFILAVSMGIVFFAKNTTQMTEEFKPSRKYAVLAGFAFAASLFFMSGVSKFLYFQF